MFFYGFTCQKTKSFFLTGNLWSHLQRFDHKYLQLVMITQEAILTVNGSIENLFSLQTYTISDYSNLDGRKRVVRIAENSNK